MVTWGSEPGCRPLAPSPSGPQALGSVHASHMHNLLKAPEGRNSAHSRSFSISTSGLASRRCSTEVLEGCGASLPITAPASGPGDKPNGQQPRASQVLDNLQVFGRRFHRDYVGHVNTPKCWGMPSPISLTSPGRTGFLGLPSSLKN